MLRVPSNILFTWEHGAGIGHLVPFRRLIRIIKGRGHQAVVAARDVRAARCVLGDLSVPIVQAPIRLGTVEGKYARTPTLVHILHNIGLGDPDGTVAECKAWRDLIGMIRPTAVVLDHSPTALLATHGQPIRRVHIGSPFTVPPDAIPLPPFLPAALSDSDQLRLGSDEQRLCDALNAVLTDLRAPAISSIAELYATQVQRFLLTIPELDPFTRSAEFRYCGMWWEPMGEVVKWPLGPGPRVFAYLRPFPLLGEVFKALQTCNARVIACIPDCPPLIENRFRDNSIHVYRHPIDLHRIDDECEAAILYASSGMAAQCAVAGIPTVHIPQHQEQIVIASMVHKAGVGRVALPDRPDQFNCAIQEVLSSAEVRRSCLELTERYESLSSEGIADRIVDCILDIPCNV